MTSKIGMILRIINPKINTNMNKKQIDLFKPVIQRKTKAKDTEIQCFSQDRVRRYRHNLVIDR